VKAADLEAFELALSEESLPFKERAIKVHEKNIELLQAGVFNEWTKKSLGRLTDLMPGRYAKTEMSSAFLVAIDSYVYRSPVSQVSGPKPSTADMTPGKPDQTTHPATMPVDVGVVKHANPQ
jgi:hypothetical protein